MNERWKVISSKCGVVSIHYGEKEASAVAEKLSGSAFYGEEKLGFTQCRRKGGQEDNG